MEYPKIFSIDGANVKAIDHIIDSSTDVLAVLCHSTGETRFRKARIHQARWFDVTSLPNEVCEWYYKLDSLKAPVSI